MSDPNLASLNPPAPEVDHDLLAQLRETQSGGWITTDLDGNTIAPDTEEAC